MAVRRLRTKTEEALYTIEKYGYGEIVYSAGPKTKKFRLNRLRKRRK